MLLGIGCMDFVRCLFFGYNRQHMSVYAKRISSGVRKVLNMAEINMSLGTFQGAAALVAGLYLM